MEIRIRIPARTALHLERLGGWSSYADDTEVPAVPVLPTHPHEKLLYRFWVDHQVYTVRACDVEVVEHE